MKAPSNIPGLQGRPFKGKLHLKIRRVKQEPRQKIRQLLRSFEPLTKPQQVAENRPSA